MAQLMASAGSSVRTRHRRAWLRMFFGGLGLWIAAVVVTLVTLNSNLVPTIILIGSFLVPVTFVAYAFEHYASDTLSEHTIFVAFVYGGILGVLGASLLETYLLGQSNLAYLGVGLIEEGCKLAALWLVARRLREYHVRDGIALGAAVGFGFAAFETAGYAFNALLTPQGLSLGSLVETQVLRGILAPVGHGLWTGILGGVMFYAARGGRKLHVTRGLVGWYLLVSVLHAFWDSAGGIAALLVLLITANTMQADVVGMGRVPAPTAEQVHLLTTLTWTFLIVDAIIGLVLFWAVLRRREAA
jgi:RsiW-degrading membrane proteinase PrsW (M82 family)